MIISRQKPLQDILAMLEGYTRVFITGCSECATLCRSGGRDEVLEMAEALEEAGKEVVGWVVLEPACSVLNNRHLLNRVHKEETSRAEVILVLACGSGVQAVREATGMPVLPGTDTLFLAETRRYGHFIEVCRMCGECILDKTGGICPVARCPKNLLNGPCGGAEDGMCEITGKPCVWHEIYTALSEQGNIRFFREYIPPKDWSRSHSGGPQEYIIGRGGH